MAETQLDDARFEGVLRSLFGVKPDTDADDIPTRTKNNMDTVWGHFRGATGLGIDSGNRGTAWAAFNALTQYASHDIGVRVPVPQHVRDQGEQATDLYKLDAAEGFRIESNLLGGNAETFRHKAFRAVQAAL